MPQLASPSLPRGRHLAGVAAVDPRREGLGASRSGNVSSRFPRSPFGSRISVGIPCSSASSISATPRPVLPDPVMPDDHPVGGEVGGLDEHRLAGARVVGVDGLAQEELARRVRRSRAGS